MDVSGPGCVQADGPNPMAAACTFTAAPWGAHAAPTGTHGACSSSRAKLRCSALWPQRSRDSARGRARSTLSYWYTGRPRKPPFGSPPGLWCVAAGLMHVEWIAGPDPAPDPYPGELLGRGGMGRTLGAGREANGVSRGGGGRLVRGGTASRRFTAAGGCARGHMAVRARGAFTGAAMSLWATLSRLCALEGDRPLWRDCQRIRSEGLQ
jgi:hypothetical protein